MSVFIFVQAPFPYVAGEVEHTLCVGAVRIESNRGGSVETALQCIATQIFPVRSPGIYIDQITASGRLLPFHFGR